MKTIILSAVATGCLLLAGCSKSGNASSPASTPAVASSVDSKPLEMKIKWVTGKKYAFHLEVSELHERTAQKGAKDGYQVTQELVISPIRDLSNGGHELELEFTGQTLETRSGERLLKIFDSADDPSRDQLNPYAAVFRHMIGARVRYLVDADGKVDELEGYDDMVKQVCGGQARLEEIFRKSFSEETMRRYCALSPKLPGNPVKPGDTWVVDNKTFSPVGTIACDVKCTLKGEEQHDGRTCVRYEYFSDIPADDHTTYSHDQFSMSRGKVTGDTWFDPDLGMVVEYVGGVDLVFKAATKQASGKANVGQKISLKLKEVTDGAAS